MLPFSFEDRCPDYCPQSGYGATNEEPLLMRGFVKPFKRGLAIASAGEVTFLTLLPKAKESLTLVDHAYPSLKVFCIKAMLLATLGPVATRNLLITEKMAGWKEAIAKIEDSLPRKVFEAPDHLYSYEAANVRREWFYADLGSLKRAAANLHKVKLIHGDLLDTADRGPYDFLYLSNALEHSPRRALSGGQTIYPNVEKLSSTLLRKGSTILWVEAQGSSYGANKSAHEKWPIKQHVTGYRTNWVYNLSKRESA